MKVTVFVIAAVFSLAHGNPVPQTTGSCGASENYNPYTDQCVQYASPSSCGLLGIACDSGEWCSNAQNLNAPGDWGCCPQNTIFNEGACVDYTNSLSGCGASLGSCNVDTEYCSQDPSQSGTQQVNGQTTADPSAYSCCPYMSQFSSGGCNSFNSSDSCGSNFQSCDIFDACTLNPESNDPQDINNWSCQFNFSPGAGQAASPWGKRDRETYHLDQE